MTTIAIARKALGLDQKGLAKALGVSQASVSRYERGLQKPGGDVVLALLALAKRKRVKLDLSGLSREAA